MSTSATYNIPANQFQGGEFVHTARLAVYHHEQNRLFKASICFWASVKFVHDELHEIDHATNRKIAWLRHEELVLVVSSVPEKGFTRHEVQDLEKGKKKIKRNESFHRIGPHNAQRHVTKFGIHQVDMVKVGPTKWHVALR